MMNGFLVGADRDDLHDRARRLAEWRGETDRAAADIDGWIAGGGAVDRRDAGGDRRAPARVRGRRASRR